MKSRIITLLVALLCLPLVGRGQSVWNGTADVSWYDESQTEFTITTAEQLAGLASLVNAGNDFKEKTIVLANDIVLNENVLDAEKKLNSGNFKKWTPIGNSSSRCFRGTFNGNNKIISGLYINNTFETSSTNPQFIGLFGSVGGSGITTNIQNLKIIDSYIKNEGAPGNIYLGGIVGYARYTVNISNISFDGLIIVNAADANIGELKIGGICGHSVNGNVKIEVCYNNANINVSLTNMNFIGTSEGYITGIGIAKEISDSYNAGDIIVSIENVKSSGIIGISGIGQNAGIIDSCYNLGNLNVSGDNNDANILTGGIMAYSSGTIQYCYNYRNINSTVSLTSTTSSKINYYGSISGMDFESTSFTTNYYLQQMDIPAVGGSTETEGLNVATEDQFQDGTVAYELRKAGGNYGQLLNTEDENDETPVLLAFKENKEKEVYKRTLNYDKYNGEAEQAEEKEAYVNSGNLCLPELNENEGWYDAVGNLYTNESTLSPEILDITLYAEVQTPHTITISETEGGKVEANKTTAIKGETITLVVTPDENYQLESITVTTEGGATITTTTADENIYTFIMPDENVTVSATFTKMEEQPGDDDEDQGDTGIHKPQRPIKYYNIYVDTICPGLEVEVSKDVVQEGHQVSAYLTIQSECDTTGMRFEYKRGLFGYWQDLKVLEGVQPGEYIIKNIYTDIYIRALDATLPEEEPTGIENLESIKAYAKDGSIYIYTPNREEVTIIGMSGAIIKHAEQVGLQSYSVSRGIYIVKIGEKVFKLKN